MTYSPVEFHREENGQGLIRNLILVPTFSGSLRSCSRVIETPFFQKEGDDGYGTPNSCREPPFILGRSGVQRLRRISLNPSLTLVFRREFNPLIVVYYIPPPSLGPYVPSPRPSTGTDLPLPVSYDRDL